MTSREMNYDLKQKLNVVDSNRYRNLKAPEIDWKLNEAQELFIKMIAQPRIQSQLGFEINQRTTDDIRKIVVNQKESDAQVATLFDDTSYLVTLPTNYMFYLSSKCIADKGECLGKVINTVVPIQHDDDEEAEFTRSSFEWGIVNIRFIEEGIRVFTDKTFVIQKMSMNYIRQPRMIYDAVDYVGGSYTLLTGEVLTGTQDCELPVGTHREIVDLAVFITAGDLNLSSYGIKQNKVRLNN